MDSGKTGASAQTSLSGVKERFLSFEMEGESYRIDMDGVVELIGIAGIEPGEEGRGVAIGRIRMRGKTIPIVDLKSRLGKTPLEVPAHAVVIVVRLGDAEVGIPVDDIVDILDRGDDEAHWESRCADVTYLDLHKLFTREEISRLETEALQSRIERKG